CSYYSLDTNGVITRINDTALHRLGYQREEVVGKLRSSHFLTLASRQRAAEHYRRVIEQGWVRGMEFDLTRRDGTLLPVLVNAKVIKDAEGNLVATRWAAFDITAQREVERLRQEHLAVLQQAHDE